MSQTLKEEIPFRQKSQRSQEGGSRCPKFLGVCIFTETAWLCCANTVLVLRIIPVRDFPKV